MNLPDIDSLDAETVALIKANLPNSLDPVVVAIGLKSTLALVEGFGGQLMAMPKHQFGPGAATFARIAEVVGLESALLMSKNFGGEKLLIPLCLGLERALRNRDIIRDFDELTKTTSAGNAINELTSRYRLSWRQVESIVNGKAPLSKYKRAGGATTKKRQAAHAKKSKTLLSQPNR